MHFVIGHSVIKMEEQKIVDKRKTYEPKLFNIILRKKGLELFDDVCNFIDEEKRKSEIKQLHKRLDFEEKMSDVWNNSGWNDEQTHSKKLDIIRKESDNIQNDVKELNIDLDDFYY